MSVSSLVSPETKLSMCVWTVFSFLPPTPTGCTLFSLHLSTCLFFCLLFFSLLLPSFPTFTHTLLSSLPPTHLHSKMAHSATSKDLQAALSLLTLGDRALPANLAKPKVGIVCGSGLGGLVNILRNKVEFAYTDIPGFVNSTGKLSTLSSIPVPSL